MTQTCYVGIRVSYLREVGIDTYATHNITFYVEKEAALNILVQEFKELRKSIRAYMREHNIPYKIQWFNVKSNYVEAVERTLSQIVFPSIENNTF
jgi:hypothetical protein